MTERPSSSPAPGDPDPYATQTWSSETWDTTYQPTVPPQAAAGSSSSAAYPAPSPSPSPSPERAWPDASGAGQEWPGAGSSAAWPAAGTGSGAAAWPEAGTGAGAASPWPGASAGQGGQAGGGAAPWGGAGTGAGDAGVSGSGWPEVGRGTGTGAPGVPPEPAAPSWARQYDTPAPGTPAPGTPAPGTPSWAAADDRGTGAGPWPETGGTSASASGWWQEPGTGASPVWPEAGTGAGPAPSSEGADPYARLSGDAGYTPAPQDAEASYAAGPQGADAPYTPARQGAHPPYTSAPQGADASYGSAPQGTDAAATAYLPPVRDDAPAPYGTDAAATAYLPPVRDGEPAAQGTDAAATAYLPPVRDDAPAPHGTGTGAAVEETGPGGPAYSSPVTLGNTRIRDPRQARAEGRSPIIDPGPQSALLTAGLGALMALAAAFGAYALLLPLVALQGLTAAGWFRLNGMWPARQGIALAFAGALAADAAVLAVAELHAPGAIIGTLGVWVLLTLVLQLRSHADPDERVYGLMASVASAALAIVCAGYLAADPAAVTTGAAAVGVAALVRALPLPPAPSVAASLLSAAGAGLAVGGLTSVGVGGALVGLAAGVCTLIGLRVAAYDYPSKFVHMTAGVALPLAAAAPAVYLVGRVVG
ncbi:hypothetical protein [Streptomyces sp. NPDC086023]|uniref:hypothetical protein n=1 Tax=Streptomyces sp. NPDC086023 TaxID=3365746 RepID=UPI0037D071F1